MSQDGNRFFDVGSEDIWKSIYYTAVVAFRYKKRNIHKALAFMETGKCAAAEGYETARQFNLIRDEFAKIPPEKVVYDLNNRTKKAPWMNNLSPVITSFANLFTTAEGQDLLFEVVSILTYGQICDVDIIVE